MTIESCSRCKGTGVDPELENNQVCKKCSGLKNLDWIANITGIEFSREEKALIYVIKMLNDLSTMGIMSGDCLKLGENAENIIKNFEPSKKEIEEAVSELKQQGFIG